MEDLMDDGMVDDDRGRGPGKGRDRQSRTSEFPSNGMGF
jgi:hypothetical protein